MADIAPTKPRGLLIVFEGLDRSGKSTQCKKLGENLEAEGHSVKNIRFPDRSTPTGASINTYLTSPSSSLPDQSIHLLFSANRWEALPSMLSTLSSGTHLIVDRYSYSGAVYSAAKVNPTLTTDWAWAPEIGLPEPDIVFYLTVSEGVQEARGGFGDERYETRAFQREVRRGFEGFWGRCGLRDAEDRRLWVVQADRTVDEVAKEVEGVVKGVLGEGSLAGRPIGKLGPLVVPVEELEKRKSS